jgi:hypothetical protein
VSATLSAGAGAPRWGEPGYDALTDLWARLGRPFEVLTTVGAVTGLSPSAVARMVGLVLATCPEASRLLEEFPRTVRNLATSMRTQAERCVGELRGPVLWSETMSARGSSFGDEGLFVCAAPSRAYDIDENQVLVAALGRIEEAARWATEGAGGDTTDDERLRTARHHGAEAARFGLHPSLARVTRRRPTARALERTRAGKHRRAYEPALRMLERADEPVGVDDVRAWCDERALARLRVLMGVVDRLERRGGTLPAIRAERGALYCGPVQYRHTQASGAGARAGGVVVGQVLVDVPDDVRDRDRERATASLQARSRGRPVVVVLDDGDVDEAVELAVRLARATG